jgi:mannose-6-phosphate isomerase-like protein (cupin superfamily)
VIPRSRKLGEGGAITVVNQQTSESNDRNAARVVVIPPEAGEAFTAFGSTAQFKLNSALTTGRLSLALAVTPPGGGPPLHVHHSDDELFIVVEGELEFATDDGPVRAQAGGVAYLPKGARHTFRNVGTTPSRHWVLTTPSGFDEFYKGAAELFKAGRPNPQELGALAARYGYEILGAPPAQSHD